MKIRPVILCGGAGTRLWPDSKKNIAKQFIDFGGWSLLGKTLQRVKNSLFDYPIISTNAKYLKEVKNHLKKYKIKKYKILLEPAKKNTGPAILTSALVEDIHEEQPLIILSADHLIENEDNFFNNIKKYRTNLTSKNIFIFGIKPNIPTDQFGYFITKKNKGGLNQVTKFIEKPRKKKAIQIIKKGGYWNSGMFFARKDSIIYNFKRYQIKTYNNSLLALKKGRLKNNIYFLNKKFFNNNLAKSFDYAILEKMKDVMAINLNIDWSDLGSWKEILSMFYKNRKKYLEKKNIFIRPWGKYTNLFKGNNFLIKELYVKPNGLLSLQKHFHRSEHWLIIQGKPKITINNQFYFKKPNETVFIPKKTIHRIHNPNKKPVKIMEAQLGLILKETDIVRYEDIYGRVN